MSSPAPSSTGISNSALGMLGVFGIPGLSQAAVAANSIANSVLGNQTTSVQAISDADANAANQAGVTIGGPPGFEGIADNSNSGNAASNAGLSGTAAGISAGAGNGQAGLSGSNPGEQGSEASSGGGGGGSGGGCFLTEAAMRHAKATHSDHDDQSLELELMRGFRDNYMMQDPGLRDLVMQYYDLAPRVVKALDKHPQADEIYAQMREKFLRPGVEHVLHGRPDQALKTYAQLLDFVAPHAGTPEARTLGAGGRMVDSAIEDQGYAKGGKVVEETLTGALGALRKLATKAAPMESILPEATTNLPAVLGPNAGPSFSDLAGQALNAPLSRRTVLKQAAGAAMRSALPDLGALGEATLPTAARALVKPTLAAPVIGSFEEAALPGIMRVIQDATEHKKLAPFKGYDEDEELVSPLHALGESLSTPQLNRFLAKKIGAHLDPRVAKHYDVTPDGISKLIGRLADDEPLIYGGFDASSQSEDFVHEANLDEFLNEFVSKSPKIGLQSALGKAFPKARVQDWKKADEAFKPILGNTFSGRESSVSSALLSEDNDGQLLSIIRDLADDYPGLGPVGPLQEYASTAGSLFKSGRHIPTTRAKIYDNIAKYRELGRIIKEHYEHFSPDDGLPEWWDKIPPKYLP